MISIWEKDQLAAYDFVIAGGGTTGLSTAIALLEAWPRPRVLVVEKGMLPSGASTKNAGFACFGSLTELLDDLTRMPESQMLELVQMRWDGLKLLRRRFGDHFLDYEPIGGYELLNESQLPALDRLASTNAMLRPIFDQDVFALHNSLIRPIGFGSQAKALVFNQLEGMLHPGKMIKAMQQMAASLGAQLMSGTTLTHFEGQRAKLSAANQPDLSIRFGQLILCTNAFTDPLLGTDTAKPGRGMVIATEPIPGLRFRGAFHLEAGYYYFRSWQGRVLLGGGRHLDFAGEQTLEPGTNPLILSNLERLLRDLILPDTPYQIAQQWSGVMAFGQDKMPIIRRINEHTLAGYRLGGMGIAIGPRLGQMLAQMALGDIDKNPFQNY